jgi:hypothetical protein
MKTLNLLLITLCVIACRSSAYAAHAKAPDPIVHPTCELAIPSLIKSTIGDETPSTASFTEDLTADGLRAKNYIPRLPRKTQNPTLKPGDLTISVKINKNDDRCACQAILEITQDGKTLYKSNSGRSDFWSRTFGGRLSCDYGNMYSLCIHALDQSLFNLPACVRK